MGSGAGVGAGYLAGLGEGQGPEGVLAEAEEVFGEDGLGGALLGFRGAWGGGGWLRGGFGGEVAFVDPAGLVAELDFAPGGAAGFLPAAGGEQALGVGGDGVHEGVGGAGASTEVEDVVGGDADYAEAWGVAPWVRVWGCRGRRT